MILEEITQRLDKFAEELREKGIEFCIVSSYCVNKEQIHSHYNHGIATPEAAVSHAVVLQKEVNEMKENIEKFVKVNWEELEFVCETIHKSGESMQ